MCNCVPLYCLCSTGYIKAVAVAVDTVEAVEEKLQQQQQLQQVFNHSWCPLYYVLLLIKALPPLENM